MKLAAVLAPLLLAAGLAACGDPSLSTAQIEEAAKAHVREQLGLSEEAALFGKVFVGEPVEGETVLCGTVRGTRADGTVITPRRFAISTEEPRWLLFENARKQPLPSQPDKFIEWHTTCAWEEEV